MAMRGIKWPGRANLIISLVALHRGEWQGKRLLDNKEVPVITAYFEDSADAGEPKSLSANFNTVSTGTYFLGDGFMLTHEAAQKLIDIDSRNRDVLFPIINGQEINNDPEIQPGRSIIGNPPYLGGQALSGTYGYAFCNYAKWEYAPTGLSDLVVYFLRRIFSLLQPGGFTAFITTNSIKDGDVRKDGLDQIFVQGGTINMAVRGIKWPGQAKLIVSLVGLHKGKWVGKCKLDGKEVSTINTYFEDIEDKGEPKLLYESSSLIFQGSNLLGNGFIVSAFEARSFLEHYPEESQVIFPIMNGGELNNLPDTSAQRYAYYFQDWSLERSKNYPNALNHVISFVKPERDTHAEKAVRERWWLFKRPTPDLYRRIKTMNQCFIAAVVTKHLNFTAIPTDHLFTHKIYVFCTDRWDLFSCVQSSLHEVWARKYSGTLGQTLNYSPSLCFLISKILQQSNNRRRRLSFYSLKRVEPCR